MRKPKDGAYISAKLDRVLTERLARFVDETGYTKTAVLEKALQAFLDREEAVLADKSPPGFAP